MTPRCGPRCTCSGIGQTRKPATNGGSWLPSAAGGIPRPARRRGLRGARSNASAPRTSGGTGRAGARTGVCTRTRAQARASAGVSARARAPLLRPPGPERNARLGAVSTPGARVFVCDTATPKGARALGENGDPAAQGPQGRGLKHSGTAGRNRPPESPRGRCAPEIHMPNHHTAERGVRRRCWSGEPRSGIGALAADSPGSSPRSVRHVTQEAGPLSHVCGSPTPGFQPPGLGTCMLAPARRLFCCSHSDRLRRWDAPEGPGAERKRSRLPGHG